MTGTKEKSILTNQLFTLVWKAYSESEYRLGLLIESGYYKDASILAQCIEIKKLLISSIDTAKGKQNL